MDPFGRKARLAPFAKAKTPAESIAESRRLMGYTEAEIMPAGNGDGPSASDQYKLSPGAEKEGGDTGTGGRAKPEVVDSPSAGPANGKKSVPSKYKKVAKPTLPAESGAGGGAKHAQSVGSKGQMKAEAACPPAGNGAGPKNAQYKASPKASTTGGNASDGKGRGSPEVVGKNHGKSNFAKAGTAKYKRPPSAKLPAETGAGGGSKTSKTVGVLGQMEDQSMRLLRKLAGLSETKVAPAGNGEGPKNDQYKKAPDAEKEGGEVDAGGGSKKPYEVKLLSELERGVLEVREGKGLPLGTRRVWKGESVVKTAEGWAVVPKEAESFLALGEFELVTDLHADYELTVWERITVLSEGRKPFKVGTERSWKGGTYVKTAKGWMKKAGKISAKSSTSGSIAKKSSSKKVPDAAKKSSMKDVPPEWRDSVKRTLKDIASGKHEMSDWTGRLSGEKWNLEKLFEPNKWTDVSKVSPEELEKRKAETTNRVKALQHIVDNGDFAEKRGEIPTIVLDRIGTWGEERVERFTTAIEAAKKGTLTRDAVVEKLAAAQQKNEYMNDPESIHLKQVLQWGFPDKKRLAAGKSAFPHHVRMLKGGKLEIAYPDDRE